MVTIKNKNLSADISLTGAEFQSIKVDGQERLWQGDEKFWKSKAPILFPICGGLKDDKYIYNSKEYTLTKHGFLKYQKFEVVFQTENSVVLSFHSNDETKKSYPFDFEVKTKFTAENGEITVEYEVANLSDRTMPFSIGGHEGYSLPNGIENYNLVFEKEEDFDSSVITGNLLENYTNRVSESGKVLPLKYEFFSIDALAFRSLKSRKVAIYSNDGEKKVELDFEGFETLFVWTKPGAPYLCLEPWRGIPDLVGSSWDITEKTGIILLESGKTDTCTHKIKF